MTYLQENMKLALASILAFVLLITTLVIGYQASQFDWALGFSGVTLLTIKLFYDCGKYDGSLGNRGVTPTTNR
ncbi:hypothetical protein VQ574_20980 (plasmid) [Stutzerimonas frequens]|uniref:hypothetical protein n=1 Tax=Stutzerimonas frequens TaxID=2968969 RepID=UPI002DB6437A|nr:hypothetical protein [Stutzerimonas frequens]WRW29413.1 hypothetical protein VQ574_20980 [Stutzerimonas frequens]